MIFLSLLVIVSPSIAADYGAYGPAQPNSRYIGCYKDTSTRALPFGPHAYGYDPDSCAVACKDYKYFSLQHGGQCFCGNDFQDATRYGPATTCPESRLGAGWANDVFENLDYYGCTNEYLSDLAPISEYQGWTHDTHTGVNYWFGDTMEMGNGNVYDKFLVIHPGSDQAAFKTYSLNGVYRRFTAVVGPAQSGNSCPENFAEYGSFSIKISVDGVERYYRDGYGRDGYDYVDIDLTDANQITVEADSPQNSQSCDHATIAGPLIECENQCSPAVQSLSATLSGDPHFRTWNGVKQHFQGDVKRNGQQENGRGNEVQYYLMTPCKDADRSQQPFDLIGSFAQYGDVMSVENYLVLVLYDFYETYYVFLSGGISNSDEIPPIRSVYRKSDGASTNYKFNQMNYIDEYLPLNLDGKTDISDKFCITISEADDSEYKLVLTDLDDGCTLEIYNRLEGNKETYRWHWLEIQPPSCYKCTNCGLMGDFQTPYGEASLIACNGERISYNAPWKPQVDNFDPIGWTYEKEYHDNFCGIAPGDFDAPQGFECPSDTQRVVDLACQQARDDLDVCCRNIGGGFCTMMQENCEADVCYFLEAGLGEIDALVQSQFTDMINDYCYKENAQGPVPRLLYDFQDGTFDETMTGDDKYRLQPGPEYANTAQIENGVLVCDGNGYILSENNLDFEIGSHTLEILVELTDLNEGGGAFSIDSSYHPYGGYLLNQFDSIVYNENGDKIWFLGSEYNSRTLQGSAYAPAGIPETSAGEYIHLVAVFDEMLERAKLYRNGVELQNYRPDGFFTAGEDCNARLLFCRKNFDDADSNFVGNVRYGAYYDFALAEDQVLQLFDNSMVQVCGIQFEVIGDELKPDQQLTAGQALRSVNGRFVAAMQNDGDFAVYDLGDDALNAEKLFSTGTSGGYTSNYLVLKSLGGNLVVNTADNDETVYATNAYADGEPLFLLMQDDGNLVAYQKGQLSAVPYWDMKGVLTLSTSGQVDIVNNDNGFNKIVSSTTNEDTLSIKSMMKYVMYMGIILLFTNVMCVLICSEIRKRWKVVKVSEVYDDQILK